MEKHFLDLLAEEIVQNLIIWLYLLVDDKPNTFITHVDKNDILYSTHR